MRFPLTLRTFTFTLCALVPAFVGCATDKTTPAQVHAALDGGNADSGSADAGPAPETVTLDDGTVQGDVVGGSVRFLKIPFAKPPTGDLRWKAPVKEDPWTGIRHEADFTEPCAQNASSQGPASSNEDCLYLNVWTPTKKVTKAAVLVWFHGGGNFAGSTSDALPTSSPSILWYDGQFFAKNQHVLVVSVDYRLGPLGFFSHPALAGESSPLGNQGLLDQRRSLEWVRDNIARFGGDPGNVTIFGESAGSADVCFHVASPGSAGLFTHAISESGGCTVSINGGKVPTAQDSATGMAAFTKVMGCDTAADALACLRGKSADDILANAAQPAIVGGADTTPAPYSFNVVVDGASGFLPDQPRALFDAGKVAKVPYLLGSNNDEGALFLLGATAITTADGYTKELTARFGALAPQVAQTYPASSFGGDYQAALVRVVTDSGLVCGTHDTARRAAKAGLPVYMYNFDVPWAILPTQLKASHASEMSHVFGNPYKPDASSTAVGVAMNTFWATFAKTGDPNYAGAPATWPPFGLTATDDDDRLEFAADPSFATVHDFRKAECAFWRTWYDANQ